MLEIKKYSDFDKPLDCTPSSKRKIEYIVLHYTAGVSSTPGTAKNICAWWNKDPGQASADYVVDDDNVWQYSPDIENYYCWHCGGRKLDYGPAPYNGKATNKNTIGIEMCSYRDDKNGKATAEAEGWKINNKVISNTVELVKYLKKKYNIPNENIITHFDVTGKLCPRPFVKKSPTGSWTIIDEYMAQFRNDETDDKADSLAVFKEFMGSVVNTDTMNTDESISKFEVLKYIPSDNSMELVAVGNDLLKLADLYSIKFITSSHNLTNDFISFTTDKGDLFIVRKNSIRIL